MIEARHFVEAARQRGFDWYAGVPCSYLTPFINYVLQEPGLRYVSMANEGDAVALIAGVSLGGRRRGIAMMQNSGLGNAVSPLTSLTWTFRLPQLLIVTWRGQPGVADEPQHALMGPITPTMLDTMEIHWELFPTQPEAIGAALDRATAHMDSTGLPYALLMQKGSVAAFPLNTRECGQHAVKLRARPIAAEPLADGAINGAPAVASRADALREVVRQVSPASTAVFASTGFCGRELYAIDDRPNHFYMVGSMGCVVPLALGFALARPELNVLALDGDGAALMRLGAFATVGAYGPANLWHLLLDNGAHDSTGGQATVSPSIAFGAIASACGYATSIETYDAARLAAWLGNADTPGPRFARLFTRRATPADLPRPEVNPIEVRTRLMRHFSAVLEAH